MEIKDWVAIYAALVGTGGLLLSLFTFVYDRRPRLHLSSDISFILNVGIPSPKAPVLSCTIANVGRVPVTLDAYFFQVPASGVWPWRKKAKNFFCQGSVLDAVQMPHELAPGKRCSLGIWGKEIAQMMSKEGLKQIRLIPLCVDQTRRAHRGRAHLFTLQDLTEPDRATRKTAPKPDTQPVPPKRVRWYWPFGRRGEVSSSQNPRAS